MLYEKKYFGNGTGNFDDADFTLLFNQWVNLENARIGSTDKGVIGTVESVGGNVLLSSVQPSVTFCNLGSAVDEVNQRIIYFVKDLYGPWDSIILYDVATATFYNLIKETNVIGGLGFDKNMLIQARVVNGLLYWTDNLNQPRRINIDAAINMQSPGTIPDVEPYINQLDPEVITVIRRPPIYPIRFTKLDDPDLDSNQIKNNAFRFSYYYTYRDGENSTIAPHSVIANYNFADDTYNTIDLEIPLEEQPDQDVQIVTIVVIYVDGNNAFVVRTWNKGNPSEAAEIAAHVAGTTTLSYNFTNDTVGEAINAAALAKPFDTVPLISETLEQGTNRLYLGRNLLGYDTPITNSLTASVLDSGADEVQSWYYEFTYNYSPGCPTVKWLIMQFSSPLDGTHPAGFYDYTPVPLLSYEDFCSHPVTDLPAMPVNIADITYIGPDISDVTTYIAAHDEARLGITITSRSFVGAIQGFIFIIVSTGNATTNTSILKSDSAYQLGIVFYDQYLRQCGVSSGPKVTTPDREYSDAVSLQYAIEWELAAGALPNEIPDWAYYYSIVVTKSLRTSFFVQARTTLAYATKDADGNYEFTATTFADTNVGVAAKLDLLNGSGLGYSFNAGDIIKIYRDLVAPYSGPFSLAVIDQVGDYVIGELKDVGIVGSDDSFFEIYTPTPQASGEFFYEVGQINNILDPGTTARRYETLSGIIPGDIYLIDRGTSPDNYITENMSPNSTFWRNWFTSVGRIQIKDSIGQRYKETSVKWSNTFIPGTITNGLSSFDSLDEKILPGEMGPLRKLQITSKVNNELGAVMLGICELETASMYLGEQQLVGSAANAFIAQASDVIGTVNILKGSFGTRNPESVTEFKGNVYWIDVLNGKVIQYSLNGLFPISSYKMTRYWKLFCDQYMSMTQSQIEALGSRPFIWTTVDPHHWELLVTVPKLLQTPPKGYLPDYPGYIYPFDIWDGQAKTLVYKISAEPNFWQGSYNYTAEGYATIQNLMFAFKHGQLYRCNDTNSYGNFFGTQYKSRIMFICNQEPERDKVYNNMSVEANLRPTLTYFMSLSPYMQVSNLQDYDWAQKESVLYCQIYRNVLTPSAIGLKINALITGEKMRTYALRVMLEFSVSTLPLELRYTTLGYQLSLGNQIPIK